ncbi:thioredoxin, mitochondrial-like, partial [Stegodyphus dumicola]|uniref:thioredoxin, mitochondrial-like n=1 Tax=Stegodyphus dumicola TaxID=202533 RepID=UPI0015AC8C4B
SYTLKFIYSWCGPCKILEPRLETIIGSKNDKVHLAKVDIDANAELAMQYNVSEAVPHVIAYKNGQKESSFIGVQDQDQIESFVNKLIGS